jgi:hypothetical protein
MLTKQVNLAPYREAIRTKVCSFCLDHGPDGCARPPHDPCALEAHLESIVPAILSVGRSRDIDDYQRAIRSRTCADCREDARGGCALRSLAECALEAYLLRIVEVIEEVATARGELPRPGSRRP